MNIPPPGTRGDARLIRIGTRMLRDDPRACPRGTALHARPLLQDPERSRYKPIQDFALGPVMNVLDRIEHRGKAIEEAMADSWANRNCHPSHVEWTGSAVTNYLRARVSEEEVQRRKGRPATFPVPEEWAVIDRLTRLDARGADRYERTAWGRRYASADGTVRELWLPSVNSVKEDRDAAEIAGAAWVALTGVPARGKYGGPYVPTSQNDTVPRHVRVIGVGCGDGEARVLADWDAHEVSRRYEELVRPALRRVVGRTELNPGSDCVGCEALVGCEQPVRIPGLLGVPEPVRPRRRRSVSAADLRVHDECPARFHLTRVLYLKGSRLENEAIRRGRSVDAVLNERHGERSPGGCRDLPLPEAFPGLGADEAALARRMLDQHRSVCPLRGLPDAERVLVQPRLTAYDPAADAVVIADPDLLYTDAGGWVWRETKTSSAPIRANRPLLDSYPQLALAVLLMAAGVPGGDTRRSRIELEVLYEHGSALEVIDPFDEPTRELAAGVVSRLACGWSADETYAPVPGRHCTGCEALTWCAAGRAETAGSGPRRPDSREV